MKKIKFIFNLLEDLDRFSKLTIPEGYVVELYDENMGKTKRKVMLLKASLSAKLCPFITIYEDKKLLHAFYQEAGDSIADLAAYFGQAKKLQTKLEKDVRTIISKGTSLQDLQAIITKIKTEG